MSAQGSMPARPADRQFGARPDGSGQVRFRLWAPGARTVALELDGAVDAAMDNLGDGWFECRRPAAAGSAYRFQIDGELMVPDPASAMQAGDVHDASLVVEHGAYVWRHADWPGRPWHEAVIYELHVGAMGGFAGVTKALPRLRDLGVTAIELMPVADFPGPRNWGYDGVLPYAPDRSYGTPEEMKDLIDAAHGLGLMVILDVVYNHFGPEGNYIGSYAPQFYRHDRTTPWGDAIDFRRPEVRAFFIENALSWIVDYQLDGLRFDAVHAIEDDDFLHELEAAIRAAAPAGRPIHLILENERNDAALLRPAPGQPGFDAQWADDLHHCLHVLLTGESEGYYGPFEPKAAKYLARCLAEGFALQGGPGETRGTPSGHLPATDFVICLQNHDQIGNRAMGERIGHLASDEALAAATAVLLLTPQIPLLFMGQEWAASAPFQFFTAYEGELAEAVRAGRRREFAHFKAFADAQARARIPDPNDPATFAASRPDPAEAAQPPHAGWLALHKRLLAIRAAEIVPRIPGMRALEAEPLGRRGVLARWRMGDGAILVLTANLGPAPLTCPTAEGRLLFATGERTADGSLAAWSVETRLKETSDER